MIGWHKKNFDNAIIAGLAFQPQCKHVGNKANCYSKIHLRSIRSIDVIAKVEFYDIEYFYTTNIFDIEKAEMDLGPCSPLIGLIGNIGFNRI